MRDAVYRGPLQIEDTDFYKPVSQAYGEARKGLEQLGSVGGRMNLIADVAQPGRRISKGRLTLDEALLASDPGAQTELQRARGSLGDLDTRLSEASEAARTRAQGGAATTQATRDATRGSLGEARTAFETGLEGRLAGARKDALARAQTAKEAVSGGFTYGLDKKGEVVRTIGRNKGKYDSAALSDAELGQLGMDRQQLTAMLRGGKGAGRKGPAAGAPGKAFKDSFGQQYLFRPESATTTDQTLADLGLTRKQYDTIFGGGLDPVLGKARAKGMTKGQQAILPATFFRTLGDAGRYIDPLSAETEITRGNVASGDDYKRLEALNSLSDEQNFFLNPDEAGRAGTANLDLTNFNKDAYSGAARGALEAALKDSYRMANFNRRSGGDSFLKKYAAPLATGGIARSGSSIGEAFSALGQGVVNPLGLVKRKLGELAMNPNSIYSDPAGLFSGATSARDLRAPTEQELAALRGVV
jgi:hypothetical protein